MWTRQHLLGDKILKSCSKKKHLHWIYRSLIWDLSGVTVICMTAGLHGGRSGLSLGLWIGRPIHMHKEYIWMRPFLSTIRCPGKNISSSRHVAITFSRVYLHWKCKKPEMATASCARATDASCRFLQSAHLINSKYEYQETDTTDCTSQLMQAKQRSEWFWRWEAH